MVEMSLGGLRITFMPLFLGINLVNMLKSLVLLGLTCHLKMSFSIKMSPQIQKLDLEVRVNWRGQHQAGFWISGSLCLALVM